MPFLLYERYSSSLFYCSFPLSRLVSSSTSPQGAISIRYIASAEVFQLTEVVTNHLWSDVDSVENFPAVDADLASAHLGNHEHIAEMRFDDGGLLICRRLLLRLAKLLDETHRLALQAAREASAGTSMDELDEVFGRHVEERVKFMTSVRELAEGAPALEFSGLFSVVRVHGCRCGWRDKDHLR